MSGDWQMCYRPRGIGPNLELKPVCPPPLEQGWVPTSALLQGTSPLLGVKRGKATAVFKA